MKLESFNEQVFFTTVRITLPDSSGTGGSVGTGFLFTQPVDADRSCILLVSNRHVYQDPTKPIQLHFHRRNPNDSTKPLLGQPVVLSDKAFDAIYTPHPNADVDLACINVSVIGEPGRNIFHKTLKSDLLADFSHEHFLPGNEVWFVGYPENRFDTTNNLPIMRRGYLASIPGVDFEGKPQFLIDAQVFPGSSGSPVFTTLGGYFRLIGIVAQTMIRNQHLQTVPTALVPSVQQTIGLGIVLKSTLLVELLDTAVAKFKPADPVATTAEPVATPPNT